MQTRTDVIYRLALYVSLVALTAILAWALVNVSIQAPVITA